MKKLTFEIRSPAHQQNAIHAVQQILPDPTKPIVVTIQERNRSLDQNRKLWACLGDVSRQVEWHGQRLSPEDWKDIFTALWLKTKNLEQRSVPGIDGGVVLLGVRTSKMRKASMTELIEIMFWFGSERKVRWSDDSRREYEWSQRTGRAA
ncbi:recombination protein NinB [Salmonella enterica]|nr:recombination protein NinB [Salmonella enterica]EBO4521784.1 recombination protein NinB [Salmonella enterica]EDZ7180087.1 recombination protein NinB [Salmonella enterica]EGD5792451.1 recombination protein NinB [Salmonella enterica]EIA6498525.1 recombination protein NinB [Salmonella enterica]